MSTDISSMSMLTSRQFCSIWNILKLFMQYLYIIPIFEYKNRIIFSCFTQLHTYFTFCPKTNLSRNFASKFNVFQYVANEVIKTRIMQIKIHISINLEIKLNLYGTKR